MIHILLLMFALMGCDDYDESEYVSLSLETTFLDKWHNTIGYAYTGGTVKDKKYDRVGNVYSNGKVTDVHGNNAGYIEKDINYIYIVKDSNYNIVGYVSTSDGTVKNHLYDVVGYGSGENIWKAGVILLLFNT